MLRQRWCAGCYVSYKTSLQIDEHKKYVELDIKTDVQALNSKVVELSVVTAYLTITGNHSFWEI